MEKIQQISSYWIWYDKESHLNTTLPLGERIVKFLNCDCIRTEEQKLFINYYKNTEQLIALPWMPFLKCFITYCESTLGSEKNEMKAWVFGCHVYVILLTWSIYELQQTPLSEHSVSRNSG